jgi:secreted trypsin-like serine protease
MMNIFRLVRLTALVALFALALAAAVPAHAITYGVPDGNGHPQVGALVAEFDGQKDWLCSGTLIAPTVYLTAAHCTSYLESLGISDVWVTFDSVFSADSTLIHGTMHTNPGYNQRQSDTGDIAVVVLDRAVKGVTPATLPAAGLFDRIALAGRAFTAVGYGVQERSSGGGGPAHGPGGTRMVSTSTFEALNKTWLRLSQNPATGDSGTCFGDSGGPNFLDTSTMIAGITITGDSVCRSTNVTYRLDTPSARAFLANFVALP